MPYSNRKLFAYSLTRPNSKEWDLWSIGVTILEVICGPDMVLSLETDDDVRMLLFFLE